MNILLKKLLQPVARYIVRAATSKDRQGWLVDWANQGVSTVSGQNITNSNALRLSTVYACIRDISEDTAKVPLNIYQKVGESKQQKINHPLYRILHYQANPEINAMAYREAMTAHCLGWGNHYSWIQRDIYGQVASLWPLRPDRVKLLRDESERLYVEVLDDNGHTSLFWYEDIFHVHGLGYDGLTGYNVIEYARECLGAAKAAEKFGAAFFGNGCHQGGHLIHPGKLSEDAQNRLKRQIEKKSQGEENWHKILLFEEGMNFQNNSIPPEEAQFLETRQFSVPEICRWFRMPPHKVGDLSRATFSNIEQQSIEYVTDCLSGWFKRIEQAIWAQLFTDEEKNAGYYAEHVAEGLLRGDITSRFAAYQTSLQNGFMNINEVRSRENLNPVEGGDKHFVQLNMTTLDNAGEEQQEPMIDDDAIISDISDRIANAEIREIDKHIKFAETDEFKQWVDAFYEKHDAYVKKCIEPLNVNVDMNAITFKCKLKYSTRPRDVYEYDKSFHALHIKNILRGALCLTN